ncbi:TPA: phage tail protein [Streptococcus suis]|nr:phage tail protein [Streptococcus suis]HEM3645959.1 phage tail protein [Streptococcus suis]
MIYLFDKDEKLIKIVRKSAVKTALQKYSLTTERYVSDRLTVELKGLNADELEQVEYTAIQTMEDAHIFHYFYVAQKSSDELTTLIGVQSGIEELRKSPIYDKRPQNALARDVITDLLAGTNWQARFVGETTPHSTNFYYTSVFDALKKVCEVWDLEMQFFVEMNGNRIGARYIDFKQRIGEAVGKRVVYGHNALQILQEVERTNICTALVGRGKGEESGDGYGRKITFEDVVWSTTQGKPVDKPKGQKYLELPLMTRQYGIKNADGTMRPKIGFVDFSEEENPEVLIERTYKALVDAARPQLTLKTSSVYLKGVKVGDTIRVVRHDKKLDYDTRIFEITFNRLNNRSSDIKLGDRIGESNEAKAQTIADKAVEQFVNNEFSNFVQNLPDYLPSADGFNNNWYGAEDPTVKYPGKVLINDIWYKADPEHESHKIMLRWTGEAWEEILRTYDSEALRDKITQEIAQVNQSMQAQSDEHDRQVADILTNAQSIETLANQAKTDAANAMARANQVKTEAIADATAQVATVSQALNTAKTDLQNQVNAVDAKAEQAQTDVDALEIRANGIADDLLSAKQELSNSVSQIDAKAQTLTADFNNSKNDILAQAMAQTALKNRVTTVEATANGTKETVTQLSKTVNDLSGEVTSATQSIKTVEDSIDGVYTTLSKIQVGGANLLNRTRDLYYNSYKTNNTSETYQDFTVASGASTGTGYVDIYQQTTNTVADKMDYFMTFYAKGVVDGQTIDCYFFSPASTTRAESSQGTVTSATDGKITITLTSAWKRYWIKWTQTAGTVAKKVLIGRNTSTNRAYVAMPALFEGNTIRDWAGSLQDSSMEFAEYKQTIDGQLTSLNNSYLTLDGKVAQNTARIETTADGIREDVTSLQSYVDDEGTRRTEYLTASALKTAELIAVERTKTAKDYVAKSNYTEDVTTIRRDVSETKTSLNSVSSRTKAVEDGLAGVKTNYTQLNQTVNTQTGQIETINSKTADLQSGIDGVTERFENLQVGGENLLLNAGFDGATNSGASFTVGGVTYPVKSIPNWNNLYNSGIPNPTTSYHAIYRESFEGKGPVIEFNESNGSRNWKAINAILRASNLSFGNYTFSADIYATGTGTKIWFGFYYYNKNGLRNFHSGQTTVYITNINKWHRVSGQIKLNDGIDLSKEVNFFIYAYNFTTNSILYLTKPKLENGTVPTAFSLAQETIRSEIAEYKRTADQNYAGLQSTVSTLDGKVAQNKTEANQTATKLSNRLTSVETYKDGEATRAQSYFEASKTETARQITAERTAISANYVAKSTYDENVSGTTLKLNEIKTTADATKQNLATYQETVNRKLTELTTSDQTLDGKINTASAKVDTVAGQIRTEISTVEAKIPTEIGGRNYILKSQAEISSTGSWVSKLFNLSSDLLSNLSKIKTVTVSCDVEGRNVTAIDNRKRYGLAWAVEINGMVNYWEVWQTEDTLKKRISQTFTVPNGKVITKLFSPEIWIQAGGNIKVSNPKIEFGSVPTDHTLATEDLVDEISSVKTTITQTASGVEQLSTSLSTTNGKVTTAETKINQLISDVSSKVSQTDYNTLTGRVNSAETAITQNATEISKRLTSTQVESAITDKGYQTASQVNTAITGKGYQTKSDVDGNITGRGYITNSALQPYALSTTVQNLVNETADSFSRTISETKALIPTSVGGRNLIRGSSEMIIGSGRWQDGTFRKSGTGNIKTINISNPPVTNVTKGIEVEITSANECGIAQDAVFLPKGTYTFSVWVYGPTGATGRIDTFNGSGSKSKVFSLTGGWDKVTVTNTSTVDETKIISYVYLINSPGYPAKMHITAPKLETGSIPTDWSPAPEDLATVTALHNVTDTVDSHTRTIGAVGTTGSILDNVSKVTQTANGLVTEVSGTNGLKTQVSALAGSYAIQNLTNSGTVLNQINLNKDGSIKIDGSLVQITGTTYIQDGVISSAKIGSLDAGKITTGTLNAARIATNSITGSHIVFDQAFVNKMTANEALFKQLFAQNAFITSVQSTNISADMIKGGLLKSSNGITEFDLNNGNIKFTNISGKIYRQVGANQVQLTTTSWNLSGTASGSFTAINSSEQLTATRRVGLEFDLADSSSSVKIFGNNIDIYPDNAAKNYTINTNRTVRLTFDGQDIANVNSITNDSKGKWNKDSILNTSNNCAIVTSDIKLAGHFSSVEKIITELCSKANITWL